ncbi:isomerase [Mesorhizobium sp. M4B.F.Ca.ET.215.01.1.1]|uniref:WxcM-like domain-containing protein n=3 Tax=Mesorhizobium TaxID=68287 RepID=A0ABU5ANZ1_9HYPH|nr:MULTISPECIES: WxcM-like domain-containing protein [Mesorhizobium]MDX8538996.1 WxcM-like domain-containing protein [Mesorhizobium abyssinicae]RUW24181.1 isomerase [Mesorhizobium sp. M4B.F.Ca.ET.013.02.1.1]RUW71415.1 isomerase [Mesorhizobium sp. M4B.F.Ca.ET.049.02.1.2]RVD44312.1 isomerase [Mesorhizobium sp. M4B.F.Ca.ET.019.03.1.1]RWF66376.1 MAG: isomerase [Mesorhizobium sp.]
MTDRPFFVHDRGICETSHVGEGTRIWAFAHVLPGAVVGSNCNICDHVFIENDVIIGDEVTIKCGVQLWDGLRLGNRVFVGPNATFTNDRFPRSKEYPETFLLTTVEDGASIGANATILPGITIGRQAMIGAGAVVTKNVPANAVVVGNPAIIIGYQTGPQVEPVVTQAIPNAAGDRMPLGVGDCELWRLPHFSDLRGELAPLEFGSNLPFRPARTFLVYGVPSDKVRGEHAHRQCHQFLIAAHGRLSVVVDDGHDRKEVSLSDPSIGLHLPPGIWGIQYKFQPDTVLLVMASHPYDAADYIRDYSDFLAVVGRDGS